MKKAAERENVASLTKQHLSETELISLFENMVVPFSYYRMIYDESGNAVDYEILAVNHAFELETGRMRDEVIGKTALEAFPKTELYWISCFGRVALTGIAEQITEYSAELEKWYSLRAYSPKRGFVAVTVSDVTRYIREQEMLRRATQEIEAQKEENDRLAHVEPITGLPNRLSLYETFVKRAEKGLGERFSVAIFTSDNLAEILASYGSVLSDHIMRILAQRVQTYFSEYGMCFSMTGTDLVLLFTAPCDERKMRQMMERAQALIREPVELGGASYYITASCGASCFPRDGVEHDELIMKANLALYQAKRTGNAVSFYSDQIGQMLLRRTQVRNALPKALEHSEFEVFFQPQVHPLTEKILGFEALLRWHSVELGEVSPMEFIPIAEESRLIQPLGLWVLKSACKTLRKINEQYKTNLFIAVNVSGLQLQTEDFVEQVFALLGQTGVRPELLELEVTESVLVDREQRAVEKLNTLYESGVRVALDDFGTGFSSLSLLNDLKISTLKVDKTFIQSTQMAELAKMIVRLGHLIGAKVVAEGVETEEQMRFVRHSGCDRVQGYYQALPMPITSLMRYLETKACR